METFVATAKNQTAMAVTNKAHSGSVPEKNVIKYKKKISSSPTSRNFIIASSGVNMEVFFQWEHLLQLLKPKSNSCDQ